MKIRGREYVSHERATVISDLVNYARVLRNQSLEEAASSTGMPIRLFASIDERSTSSDRAAYLPTKLLPVFAGYLGCSPRTLIRCVNQVIGARNDAERELGMRLDPDLEYGRLGRMNGHLILRRSFSVNPQSPYWKEGRHVWLRLKEPNPYKYYAEFSLHSVDMERLEVEGKRSLAETIVAAPFLALRRSRLSPEFQVPGEVSLSYSK